MTEKNQVQHWIEQHYVLVLCLLTIVFFCMRLYRLGDFFVGMHVDEAGIYYDAYTLANFKVDRYLNPYPLYMINYGGGQSALYTYCVALLFKVFSPSVFLLRLPIVLSNYLLCLSAALLVKMFKGKNLSIVTFLVFLFMPYFMMQTRFALDCNLLVSSISILSLLFAWAIQKKKESLFLLTGVVMGISFYTYSLSWLILPIYFLMLCIYCLKTKAMHLKNLFSLLIPALILAIPLLLFLWVNLTGHTTIHLGPFSIPTLPWFRGNEFSFAYIRQNLLGIIRMLSFDGLAYDADPIIGTINYCMIPFLFLGMGYLVSSWKKADEKLSIYPLALFSFLAVYGVQLFIMDNYISKVNAIYFSFGLFVVWGLLFVYEKKAWLSKVWFSVYLVSSFAFFVTLPIRDNHPLDLFQSNYGDVIVSMQEEFPGLPIYIEPYTKSPTGFYLATTLPDPYGITLTDTTVDSVSFFIPETIETHSVYILRDDYENIDRFYNLYQEHPESILLTNYHDYQIYVVY